MTLDWQVFPATRFSDWRSAWDALNSRGTRSPVLHADFIGPLLEIFGDEGDRLAVLGRTTNPDAMGIFRRARVGVYDTFQPSQAPLGAWLNLADIDLADLLHSLGRRLPGPVLQVGLTQQDPDITPRPRDAGRIRTLDYIQTARVAIAGSFEDFGARAARTCGTT